MNPEIENNINDLIKSITGQDEYIFNPIFLTTNGSLMGVLSNGFRFQLYDVNNGMYTPPTGMLSMLYPLQPAAMDTRLVITAGEWTLEYMITAQTTNLITAVEIVNANIYVSTHIYDLDNTVEVTIHIGKIVISLGRTISVDTFPLDLERLRVNIPHGNIKSRGAIKITSDDVANLIRSIMGRPLGNEGLRVFMHRQATEYNFRATFVSGGGSKPAVERLIDAKDIHDMNATKQYIEVIINKLQ